MALWWPATGISTYMHFPSSEQTCPQEQAPNTQNSKHVRSRSKNKHSVPCILTPHQIVAAFISLEAPADITCLSPPFLFQSCHFKMLCLIPRIDSILPCAFVIYWKKGSIHQLTTICSYYDLWKMYFLWELRVTSPSCDNCIWGVGILWEKQLYMRCYKF